MPTKLYLLRKDTEPGFFNSAQSWTFNGWNYEGIFATYGNMIDMIKEGGEIKNSTISDSGGSAPPQNHLHYRGITRRLQPQTISGTLNGVFQVGQNDIFPGVACYTRIFASIIDTTGNPFGTPLHKAYLVNNYDESVIGGTAWPSGASNVVLKHSINLMAPVAITSYTIPNDGRDYRILIEFGCKRTSVKTGATAVPFSYMNTGTRSTANYSELPDLVPEPIIFPIGASYFDFSANITFKASTYFTNDEPERATDMGTSTVVNAIGSTGLETYYQWYKYTQDKTVDRSISALFCKSAIDTDAANMWYYCGIDPAMDGPPFVTAVDGDQPIGVLAKKPVMISLKANCNGYFRVYRGGATSATLSVVKSPTGTILAGDLLITVDNSSPNIYNTTTRYGFGPSLFYHPDGTLVVADGHVIASELGVSLANGKYGIPDQARGFIIYDKIPAVTELFFVPFDDYVSSIGTDFISFYVVKDNNTGGPTVFKVSDTGVISSKSWLMTERVGTGADNCGVSRDGKILYIQRYSPSGIYRYDLEHDVPLTHFPAPPSGYGGGDIIVLSDNTILADYGNVYHYAPDGTILHTYNVTGPVSSTDHITHEADDSADKFWIWRQGSGGPYPYTSRFQLVRIADGVVLKQFDVSISGGNNIGRENPATVGCSPVRFSPAGSCPLLTMMIPPVPPDISGIYFINPVKITKHDSYYNSVEKKIPDPTIRSAYLGE